MSLGTPHHTAQIVDLKTGERKTLPRIEARRLVEAGTHRYANDQRYRNRAMRSE